jgi:hypothetical protein
VSMSPALANGSRRCTLAEFQLPLLLIVSCLSVSPPAASQESLAGPVDAFHATGRVSSICLLLGSERRRCASQIAFVLSLGKNVSALQTFVALTVVATAFLDPVQAAIGARRFVHFVLVEAGVHTGLAW